jgi:hypothetical protein
MTPSPAPPYPAAGAPPPQPYPQPYPPRAPQPYPQPYPSQAPQPYPPQAPQPYPPQAPQPYPPQAPQPYPPQAQPAAPPGGYGPTMPIYSQVQPYAAPPVYPAPVVDASIRHSGGDGEVITDFASVGALASIDLLVRQDVRNGSLGTLLVLAGLAGGGATGWLLTDRYPIEPGAAHATTLGLLVGAANGALLIQPTGWTDADQVLGLLLLGSAAGTVGGFAYGQAGHLTSGQSTFVGNLALLGSATAAFSAIAGSRDDRFGGWEDATLALGLDAGVLGGALIAPSLDWSPHRAKVVFASTTIGAFLGGMLVGLATRSRNGDSSNGDLVAGCMTAGMWGGFGLGILITRDAEPDVRFSRSVPGPSVTVTPFSGDRGEVGMMAAGSW